MPHAPSRRLGSGLIGLCSVLFGTNGCARFGYDLLDDLSTQGNPEGGQVSVAGSWDGAKAGQNRPGAISTASNSLGGTAGTVPGTTNGRAGNASGTSEGVGSTGSGVGGDGSWAGSGNPLGGTSTAPAIGGNGAVGGATPNHGGDASNAAGGTQQGGWPSSMAGTSNPISVGGAAGSTLTVGGNAAGGATASGGGTGGTGAGDTATGGSATGGGTGGTGAGGTATGGSATGGAGTCSPVVDMFPTVPVTDGNNLFGGADDATYYVMFSLGFQFTFYGVQYPGIYLNTNGGLTFGAADDWFTADVTFHDQPSIAVFWTDMDCTSYGADLLGHQITYQQCADRFTVTFNQMQDKFTAAWVGSSTVNLRLDGSIEIQYGSVTDQQILVGIFDGTHSPVEKEFKKFQTTFTNYASYGSGVILFDPKYDNTGTMHQGELTGQTLLYSPM